MKQRLFRMRRWGVAALAGVTVLGAASVVGEGVASAAVTSVTASPVTVTTILPTGAAQVAGNLTITVNGAIGASDTIKLTALPNGGSCSSTDYVEFAATPVSSDGNWTVGAPAAGNCGTATNTVLLTATALEAGPTTTITLSGITYTTDGAANGAVALSGAYGTTTPSTLPFSVSSNATVVGVTVTPAAPLTTVATGTNNASVGNVALTMPTVGAVPASTPFVCVTLPVGDNFDTINGTPIVSQTNGASTTSSGALVTVVTTAPNAPAVGHTAADTGFSGVQGNVLSFEVSGVAVTNPPIFSISGIHIDGGTAGAAIATVAAAATAADCAAGTPVTVLGSGEAFNVGSAPSGAIYGSTPDATAAAEFDAATVKATPSGTTVSYTCSNNGNAVLATDVDPFDALSASYLEGQLSTGVLITPPTSLDPNMLAALKYAGVQRVYVVGGLLAVSQADITALEATPAYTCGGVATTGSNIQVFSGISGQTADDTAVAIDNYLSGTSQSLPSLSGAFASAGLYNQTTGNASASGPTGTAVTALVVSDTDWQDATSAAGIAYKYHVPVILTTPGALSPQASGELTKLGITQVIALGGQLALQPAVVSSIQAMNIPVLRIAGQDQTQTAADLASFEGTQLGWADQTVLLAQGAYWSDALGAAPLSANGPSGGTTPESILLTKSPIVGLGTYTTNALMTAGKLPSGFGSGVTSNIQVLGGPLAVTAAQTSAAQAALAAG